MPSSLDKWRPVTQNADLVRFVAGMFDRIGVRVRDTGEAFTVAHHGDRVELEPGVGRVDYTVEIDEARVDRLAAEAQKPRLDELERFRVVAALFTPAAAATLRHRRMSSPVLRRLAGAERLIHACLKSPDPGQEPDVCHTLVYAAAQWLVIPGLHGRPQRVFEMTTDEVADYQRRVRDVLKADTWGGWFRFGGWYRAWRKRVSRRA